MLPSWAFPAILILLGSIVALTAVFVALWFVLAAWMRRLDRLQVAKVERRLIEADAPPPPPRLEVVTTPVVEADPWASFMGAS